MAKGVRWGDDIRRSGGKCGDTSGAGAKNGSGGRGDGGGRSKK